MLEQPNLFEVIETTAIRLWLSLGITAILLVISVCVNIYQYRKNRK